jgi:hypothetical protein
LAKTSLTPTSQRNNYHLNPKIDLHTSFTSQFVCSIQWGKSGIDQYLLFSEGQGCVYSGVVIALTQIDSQQNPVMSIDSIGSTYNLGRFLGLGYGQSVLEDKTFWTPCWHIHCRSISLCSCSSFDMLPMNFDCGKWLSQTPFFHSLTKRINTLSQGRSMASIVVHELQDSKDYSK